MTIAAMDLNIHEQGKLDDQTFILTEKGYLSAIRRGDPIDQEGISLAMRRAFQLCDEEIVEMSKAEDSERPDVKEN